VSISEVLRLRGEPTRLFSFPEGKLLGGVERAAATAAEVLGVAGELVEPGHGGTAAEWDWCGGSGAAGEQGEDPTEPDSSLITFPSINPCCRIIRDFMSQTH